MQVDGLLGSQDHLGRGTEPEASGIGQPRQLMIGHDPSTEREEPDAGLICKTTAQNSFCLKKVVDSHNNTKILQKYGKIKIGS